MGTQHRSKIGKNGVWEKLQIRDTSDGDKRSWPLAPAYRPGNDENYLILLGQAWEAHPQPEVNYYIERLPDGYAVFETKQHGGGPQVYKRLFGHPKGKFYDSIQKFRPHFLWLMSGMEGDCECQLCGKRKVPVVIATRPKKQPREAVDSSVLRRQRGNGDTAGDEDIEVARGIASRRARRDAKMASGPFAVDEEGTEDVFKAFIKRLHTAQDSKRGIDQDIEELNSLDWRAEHYEDGSNLMARRITQIDHQPSFLPRIGEVVLWCTNLRDREQLIFHEKTSTYVLYSRKKKRLVGIPTWRAGVVTSTPPAWDLQNGPMDYQDVVQLMEKKTALNVAGYRMETLPDPNDPENKSASKQYKWVALRCIRPLSQWQMMTGGVPLPKLHPSVRYALTCSTSISLMEKFKATGAWPTCVIHCKGVYLGPELIMVGDTVRILSDKSLTGCEDVLRVESIRLNLERIQPEHAQRDSSGLASESWISLVGKAYTSNPQRAWGTTYLSSGNAPPISVPLTEIQTVLKAFGTSECGAWFYLHNPRTKFLFSHEQVLGRLHETAAVQLWNHRRLPPELTSQPRMCKPLLNYDVPGILLARKIATRTDSRLPCQLANENLWYWADTRAEALAVESFNGHEVGKYWHVRDNETLELWHTQMSIINGAPITVNETSAYVPLSAITGSKRGRKAGTRVVNGKLVYPGDPDYDTAVTESAKPKPSSQMAGAALASTDEDYSGDLDEEDIDADVPVAALAQWKLAEGDSGRQIYQAGEPETRSGSEDQPKSILKPVKAPKPPLSKSEIMASAIRDTIEEDSMDDQSEDSWYNAPPPPLRGGTEESSGGDYSPQRDGAVREESP